jgi:hypothetical protein
MSLYDLKHFELVRALSACFYVPLFGTCIMCLETVDHLHGV